jgi:transcription elongation factor GreA
VADGAPSSAAALLREVGLRPDGPVLWGRPLTTRAPGLYLVELAEPLASPRIELAKVGQWLEHVPDLRLDAETPTSKALAARLGSLWLPSAVVLYAGATVGSLGGRVLAMAHHVIGDRRPHADGQWLHLLTGIERTRIWFAETDAPEEYLDGVLDAFAATVRPALPATRPAGALPLPWANLRRPTGERQVHGITGSVLPAEPAAPDPPTRVVEVPPGDADGARGEERGTGTVRRTPARGAASGGTSDASESVQRPGRAAGNSRAPSSSRAVRASVPRAVRASVPRAVRASVPRVVPPSARAQPVPLTADAHARLGAELAELTGVRRRDVVARIKAARELGDLRENAEYQAAREEQSFLEGRVRLLEERLRNAVIIDESGGDRARIGSTVVIEHDGETSTYTLVGSTESDPASGRVSVASPVGAALLRAVAGEEVEVKTPRGAVRYRVIEVR